MTRTVPVPAAAPTAAPMAAPLPPPAIAPMIAPSADEPPMTAASFFLLGSASTVRVRVSIGTTLASTWIAVKVRDMRARPLTLPDGCTSTRRPKAVLPARARALPSETRSESRIA